MTIPLNRRSIRKAKQVAWEFRLARKLRKKGFSDFLIVAYEIRAAVKALAGAQLSLFLVILNSMATGPKEYAYIFVIFGSTFLFHNVARVARFITLATRKIEYAWIPSIHWVGLKAETRVLAGWL